MGKKYLIIVAFILALLRADAQVAPTIHINGTVMDIYDRVPVSGVSVINQKAGTSSVTDGQGRFSITCGKNDAIFLFLSGYQTVKFSMTDSAVKDTYNPVFEFDRLATAMSKPIIVRPKITLTDIEKQRQNLGKIDPELRQPEFSFTSPISALYEMLSGRAKERTKLREQIQDDDRRRIYKELFNYYKEEKLFDLPDEYYDQFITYLGLPVDFLKYSSDYTITKTVLDAYKKFGLERGFIK